MITFSSERKATTIDLSSAGTALTRPLHPSRLGPVRMPNGGSMTAVAGAWHYAQVFALHVDASGEASPAYTEWVKRYSSKVRLHNPTEFKTLPAPQFFIWNDKRVDAQELRVAYIALYVATARESSAWKALKTQYALGRAIVFSDTGLRNDKRPVGTILRDMDVALHHGYILKMMLLYGEQCLLEDVF